jgi:hypothetical protein
MKITLDFNEKQTEIFKSFLSIGLLSLEEQKKQLIAAVEKQEKLFLAYPSETSEPDQNILSYLREVITPQQIVISSILESIVEAESSKIVLP